MWQRNIWVSKIYTVYHYYDSDVVSCNNFCINIRKYFTGVTFSGFNDECSTNGAAIATNTNNDDGQHPVEVQGLTFDNVDMAHRVFYHRPRLS